MLRGELFRAFGYKIHVGALTQNLACRSYWIFQSFHASHAPCPQRRTVHDQRIQLHLAVAIQKASPAGIESCVVLHDDDGFLDCIQCRAAALEHAPACDQRVAHPMQVRLHHVIRHGPSAAVNNQNRITRQEKSSEEMKRLISLASHCRETGNPPYAAWPALAATGGASWVRVQVYRMRWITVRVERTAIIHNTGAMRLKS